MKSSSSPQAASQAAERTKATHLAFAQMLRSHSIPTDWMECRPLRGRNRGGEGFHLQFVIEQGGPTLLPHVKALEGTFLRQLEKLQPDAKQWVLDVAWVLNDAPESEVHDSGWSLPASQAGELGLR